MACRILDWRAGHFITDRLDVAGAVRPSVFIGIGPSWRLADGVAASAGHDIRALEPPASR